MRATVKVAYFDDLGLHKVGDVVEVKVLKSYHEAIKEGVKPAKVEAPAEIAEDEEPTEAVEVETKKKSRKATKKKKG
jgi:hypothetical protein